MSTDATNATPTLAVGGDRLATAATRLTDYESRLWAVVITTCLVDAILTAAGLRLGLTEANPIAAALIGRVGAVPALAALKLTAVSVAAAGWAIVPQEFRGLIPAGLALPWVAASAANAITVGLVLT